MPLTSRIFSKLVVKNPEVYALQVIALSIALACSVLILLFSLNEFGYDNHFGGDEVFRILKRNNAENFEGNRLSVFLSKEDRDQIGSDSATIGRVKVMKGLQLQSRHQNSNEIAHAIDSSIIDILSLKIISGRVEDFKKKNSVILSESTAKQFFPGDSNPDSITLSSYGGKTKHFVAAIIKDLPSNSHDKFDILIPISENILSIHQFATQSFSVYGKMKFDHFKFPEPLINKNQPDQAFIFQPLREIYFGPRVINENARHGDLYSVVILLAITFLILLLAISTFINLNTIVLPYRAKEIAVKKLAGSTETQLVISFLKESLTMTTISFLIGILILSLSAKQLQSLLMIDIGELLGETKVTFYIIIFLLAMAITLAPLMITLTFLRHNPNRLLSSNAISFPQFKKRITFVQLGICIFLLISSAVIKRQVNYSLIKEPGRNHDQIVYMKYPVSLTPESLRNLQLTWKIKDPHIVDVMASSQLPTNINSKEIKSDFYRLEVDPGYASFFGIEVTEGRWFKVNDRDTSFLLNENGKLLAHNAANRLGVFRDIASEFNLPARPLKLFSTSARPTYNFLFIKILEVDIRKTIDHLSTYFEEGKTSVYYLDKDFESWLKYQDRLNDLSVLLTIVSIMLSCCAIYGLIISLVRDKIKQIAIHKIHGAKSIHLSKILIKQFFSGFAIAILVFVPMAFLVLHEFLRNFAYTTPILWYDVFNPIVYCLMMIVLLCIFHGASLNKRDLTQSLKSER